MSEEAKCQQCDKALSEIEQEEAHFSITMCDYTCLECANDNLLDYQLQKRKCLDEN